MRYFEVTMPAIASLEDLKAAQEEGLSIYSMRHALCSLRGSVHLAPHDLRLRMTLCPMRYALCEKLVAIER